MAIRGSYEAALRKGVTTARYSLGVYKTSILCCDIQAMVSNDNACDNLTTIRWPSASCASRLGAEARFEPDLGL